CSPAQDSPGRQVRYRGPEPGNQVHCWTSQGHRRRRVRRRRLPPRVPPTHPRRWLLDLR
ncbi:hypothetical protein BN1723_019741, partial [Verticillium longisporum]